MTKISTMLFIAIFGLFALINNSFSEEMNIKETKIKTSAQTWMDKNRIESALNKIDGVEEVELKMDSKIVTVKYDHKKANIEEIRKVIEDMSFTAEVLSPDSKEIKTTDKNNKNDLNKN